MNGPELIRTKLWLSPPLGAGTGTKQGNNLQVSLGRPFNCTREKKMETRMNKIGIKHLDEANVSGDFAEFPSGHSESVLANDTMTISADSALPGSTAPSWMSAPD